MKRLKEINGSFLLQNDNELFVVYDHYLPEAADGDEIDLDAIDENNIEVRVKMLGHNKIEVKNFHDLHQFNCTRGNALALTLLAYGLKLNGYDVSYVERNLDHPELIKETVISDSKISQYASANKAPWDVNYNFVFKGKNIKGYGTYIKYMFFDDIERMPETLDELFILNTDLNKLIAKACAETSQDYFSSCDKWAEAMYRVLV